ncbi:MAG: ABC transporter permease [Bacteroidaceae bacterium]|nr:ABC transporter permease [Bacteroidaceae bacterium]
MEFFIARRYLFSKKSHNAINIISAISMLGVGVATMALVCTLSVFNGFQDLVADLFTAFDAELLVKPTDSPTIRDVDPVVKLLNTHPDVAVCTPVLEDQALVVEGGKQQVVTIMGVADNFTQQTQIDDILYGEGKFCLHADVLEYGVLGLQLASRLGLNTYFVDPLQIYAPKKGERVNMGNPLRSFNRDELQSPGVVFMVQQAKYDCNYIITSLQFAQKLFDRRGQYSALELKLRDGASLSAVQKSLRRQLGDRYSIQNRYEQQNDVFRIMRIEKFISYVFLTFILLVACFNIIGSLSMLMIDKRADADTLRSMGATDAQISRIFVYEGCMISFFGAIIGLLLGLTLCLLQQRFGFIRMGDSDGSFIVDAYPVSVHASDILLIFTTVIAVGWAAVWYPARLLMKRMR